LISIDSLLLVRFPPLLPPRRARRSMLVLQKFFATRQIRSLPNEISEEESEKEEPQQLKAKISREFHNVRFSLVYLQRLIAPFILEYLK
jgi:hypothetical protein